MSDAAFSRRVSRVKTSPIMASSPLICETCLKLDRPVSTTFDLELLLGGPFVRFVTSSVVVRKMGSLRTLIFAGLCSIHAAQSGWTLLLPVNVGPLSNRWSAAATAGSCMYVTGGTGAAGNATFQFDSNAMEWTQLADLPDSYLAPATVAFGGLLVMIGGQGSFGRSDDVLTLVRMVMALIPLTCSARILTCSRPPTRLRRGKLRL